jgi:exopolysaccharide biosynthesis polyprenyl glycosylphosphotransferase
MSPPQRSSAYVQEASGATQGIPWVPAFGSTRPMRGRSDSSRSSFNYSTITVIAILLDYLSVATGIVAGLLVYQLLGGVRVSNEPLRLFALSLQYGLTFILFGQIHHLYSHRHCLLQVRETARILRVSVFSFALLSIGIGFGKMDLPRLLLLLSWSFITLFVILQKHLTRRMLARWKATHPFDRRVLIIGSGSEARRIFSFLLNSPDLQLRPVAFLQEQSGSAPLIYSHDYRFKDHAPVYEQELDKDLLSELNVSDIFVADPNLSPQRINDIGAIASDHSVQVSFVGSGQSHLSGRLFCLQEMDGLLVSSSTHHSSLTGIYEVSKRMVDIAGSLFAILVSFPVWAGIAAWIKLSSEGPVFFVQERIGHGGKPFKMYKFRSMYTTAPKYSRSPESGEDPRITPAGRFIRKTSLDELPQLLNVLRGEMSLVGPRPEMPYIVSQYNSHQAQRLNVKQGITGIWQLSADRRFAIHQSVEYDLYYIEHRSFFVDLAILLHTVAFAMKGI